MQCCTVHGIKVLDSNGDGSYTDVISGLYWVLRNAQRPAVASMSLSGPTSLGINQAIEELYQSGILTIAAAGNENVDACTKSPGSSPHAVTVGASDLSSSNQDIRSDFRLDFEARQKSAIFFVREISADIEMTLCFSPHKQFRELRGYLRPRLWRADSRLLQRLEHHHKIRNLLQCPGGRRGSGALSLRLPRIHSW